MHISNFFVVSLVTPLVAAHGEHIPGAPKVFGFARGSGLLKTRQPSEGHAKRVVHPQEGHRLSTRQGGLEGRCGTVAGGASCDADYCCSSAVG
jgi:hypothetical protein